VLGWVVQLNLTLRRAITLHRDLTLRSFNRLVSSLLCIISESCYRPHVNKCISHYFEGPEGLALPSARK